MAFTITDAKTLAHSWIEETLDDAQILIHGNEFLRRAISNKLWQEKTQDFEDAVAGTYYDLPTDFYLSALVTDKTDTDLVYKDYAISNMRIKFNSDGDYTLTYRAFPALIAAITATTTDDVPPVTATNSVPLPDAFIYPLAEYLIYRYFNIELDDEDSKAAAQEYEARYTNSLRKLYSDMEIDSESDSFQVTMRW